MTIWVVDIEANGLLDTVDQIWCICAHDLHDEKNTFQWHWTEKVDWSLVSKLVKARLYKDGDELVMHNGIGYDALVLEKILGIPRDTVPIVDTLVMSRRLNPDREGGHSLEAWAKSMSGHEKKVQHEDWSKYDPHMLERCHSDVRITASVLKKLLNEVDYCDKLNISLQDSARVSASGAQVC